MNKEPLTLNDKDPAVINSRAAEKELFDFYGIKAVDHYILLPDQGIRVRVSEIGRGEPIVFVPGNTGDLFPLASLLAQFKGRRLIGINRPGGGLSEGMDHTTVDIRQFAVNTLDRVMETFKLENVDVVAHSMGAHWSLWLALDRPKRVRSLVLLGNPGNVMKGRPPLIFRLISKPPLNRLFFKMLTSSGKKKALGSLRRMGHSQDTLEHLPKALGDCYFYFRKLPHYFISLMSLMANMAPKIGEKQLAALSQPAMLLLGTKDTFASIETGKTITAALLRGAFHSIEGAGHLPWLEDPALCGQLISDFFVKNKSTSML